MAKVAAATEEHAPPKGKKLGWIIGGLVCLLAAGAGFAVPLVLHLGAPSAEDLEAEKKAALDPKQAQIPFDPVVVNVASSTYARYLRTKIILVVDAKDEKTVTDALAKKKVFLQDWVNSYLSDRTMEELHGSAAKNRIRREIRDKFNAMLFSDGSEKITELVMPEFNFQ